MVLIRFIRNGKEDPKLLEDNKKQIEEIRTMIDSCEEFDKDIEVNIFSGSIVKGLRNNYRIRQDLIDIIADDVSTKGKALLPEELCKGHKDEKICYCSHKNDFSDTKITIFHEIFHFYDPFIIKEEKRLKWRLEQRDKKVSDLNKHLKYRIISELNEYIVRYKLVMKLSSCENLKDKLIRQGRENLLYYNPIFNFSTC